MNFDRLRQLLIQKAFEGKLVPQLTSDNSFHSLNHAASAAFFKIPNTWQWITLSTLVSHIVDCPHSTPKYCSEPTQYCAIDTNCISPTGEIKQWRYVTEKTYLSRTNRLSPQEDDVIYTREGSIGRAARIPGNVSVCMGQRVMLIRPGQLINPTYLQLYLMSPAVLEHLTKNQRGIGVKHINVSDVKKLSIPVPPIEEQHRIVTRLNELLAVIKQAEDAYTDLQSLGKTLRERILQKAIEGKLVPQLDTEPSVQQIGTSPSNTPFEIPKKWKWERLDSVFTLQAGKFIAASEISSEGPYLCYGGNGVRGRVPYFNREGRFPLIGRQGALCGNINIADGKFYATEHAVVADSHGIMDADCAFFFLQYLNLNQYATQTAQPGLSVKKISAVGIPVPPLEEQRRIVAKLNELLPLIDQMTAV